MLMILLASSLSFATPEVSAQRNPDAEAPEVPTEESGRLVVEARIPFELAVDGRKLAQLFTSGRVVFDIKPGKRDIRIYTNGSPEDMVIEFMPNAETVMIVGRTGITTGQPRHETSDLDIDTVTQVNFRAAGTLGSQIRIDGERFTVHPDAETPMEIASGTHEISVRSVDGTAIWASGVLTLTGGDVVVQIAEGRLPEVTGGGHFTARGG